eukprot:GHVU01080910.1.p1 GENE.GHVU01080910.1~~GHVU01080910.1.p1  ORF type:complete len:167 (-),score=11.56 GHVU01080910.1:330-830(-)
MVYRDHESTLSNSILARRAKPMGRYALSNRESRWGAKPTRSPVDGQASAAQMQTQLPHPDPDDVSPIAMKEIRSEQQRAIKERPKNTFADQEGTIRFNDLAATGAPPIWIPDKAIDIKTRLMVITHCCDGVHSSQDTTATMLRRIAKWKGLTADVRQFVRECLHCL